MPCILVKVAMRDWESVFFGSPLGYGVKVSRRFCRNRLLYVEQYMSLSDMTSLKVIIEVVANQ
jgi:hypothetical protein